MTKNAGLSITKIIKNKTGSPFILGVSTGFLMIKNF
jgi:hypothetical protein